MKENLSYKHTEDGEVHPGRGGGGEDLAVRALRPVGQLLPVHARPSTWRSWRSGCASSASTRRRSPRRARKPGLGAGARLALRPRGLPVRQGLFRKAPRLSGERQRSSARAAPSGGRGGGRADRRRRPLPADLAARGQGLRRLLGVPGRQARSRRDGRAGAAARTARGARHHDRRGRSRGRSSWSTTRTRACACTSARSSTGRASSRCARARRWPGRRCRCRCSRCCPARCRCCDWFAAEQGFAGATHATELRRYTGPMNWLDDVKWDARRPGAGDRAGGRQQRRADVRLHEPRGAGAHRRARRGRVLEPLAPAPVAQGRGVAATSSRCTRCASIATTTWCCSRSTQLGHEPGIACHTGRHSLLLPALRERRLAQRRAGAEGPRTHLQMRWQQQRHAGAAGRR